MNPTRTTLTPLERLQLRDALQDRWRDQVRRITELSIALHGGLDGDDEQDVDAAAVAVSISDARLSLAAIERAMRGLDDRSYGQRAAN